MFTPGFVRRSAAFAILALGAFLTHSAQPVFADAATTVSSGDLHACAVTTSGSLKCWGHNGLGRLGDSTTTHRTTPVDVTGLTSGVAAVSSGASHTCAVTTSGGLKCWGRNSEGQLGDGTITGRSAPVDVAGLTTGAATVSSGASHTCAVTTLGGLKCWGRNNAGQLGDGTTTDRTTPVDVTGLTSGLAAVSAGELHTCAVTTSGGLKCWGWNSVGQLGDGTTTDRTTPVDVAGANKRRGRRLIWGFSHLRRDHVGGPQVLGEQLPRSAWDWHCHGPEHTSGCDGAH